MLTELSARGISDLERGQRRYPRLETVRLIAEALALGGPVQAELVLLSRPPTNSQDDRRGFAAPTTPAVRGPQRQVMPVLASQLIGRAYVISEVVEILHRADTRLVTLTGPGGAGKSSLAIQVATQLSEAYPGGITCVFLASIAAGASVLPAIADALGVRETGADPLAKTLGDVLGETRFLLVLDNFEHVINDAVAVNGLLERCPGLDVLVTSRAALRLRIEHVFHVEPLDIPASGSLVTVDDISRFGALELFVERVRMASMKFDVTSDDVPIICEICRRLDGLPLAIELAAARMRVLSLGELHEQLQD
ncbi:MAG: NB-ARC domain-containing protein, partial [Chloroflexota bacterium]|nr:NB-ARC domain-containing protein [Chloroflexota bacterium]